MANAFVQIISFCTKEHVINIILKSVSLGFTQCVIIYVYEMWL